MSEVFQQMKRLQEELNVLKENQRKYQVELAKSQHKLNEDISRIESLMNSILSSENVNSIPHSNPRMPQLERKSSSHGRDSRQSSAQSPPALERKSSLTKSKKSNLSATLRNIADKFEPKSGFEDRSPVRKEPVKLVEEPLYDNRPLVSVNRKSRELSMHSILDIKRNETVSDSSVKEFSRETERRVDPPIVEAKPGKLSRSSISAWEEKSSGSKTSPSPNQRSRRKPSLERKNSRSREDNNVASSPNFRRKPSLERRDSNSKRNEDEIRLRYKEEKSSIGNDGYFEEFEPSKEIESSPKTYLSAWTSNLNSGVNDNVKVDTMSLTNNPQKLRALMNMFDPNVQKQMQKQKEAEDALSRTLPAGRLNSSQINLWSRK